MKRKEIVDLLEATGQVMEFFDVTEVTKNDEVLFSVSKDVINGMQTAIYVCKQLVSAYKRNITVVRSKCCRQSFAY